MTLRLAHEVLMPDRRALEQLAAKTPSPERTAMGHQSAEALQKAVLKLPPGYRLALVLHDMEDLSTEEIAKVMGLREGNRRGMPHGENGTPKQSRQPKFLASSA